MRTTIMSIVLLLSVPLYAMEKQYFDPVSTKIAIDQRDLWRFKKRLADQPTNRRAKLWKDDFQILQKNARDALQKKKKSNPPQFANISIPQSPKKMNNGNMHLQRYKSVPLKYVDKNTGVATQRYWVRDINGNNRIYGECIPQNNLPKQVLKYIKDTMLQTGENQGRLNLLDGSAIEWYYVGNSIESYKDKQGEITYLAELAFCHTDIFLKKIKEQIDNDESVFRKMNESDAQYKEIECKILDKEKDYDLFKEVVKKYGEKVFYEKMVYALELQDQLNDIDTKKKNGMPFTTSDEFTSREKVSEIYGFEDGNYYLFGTLLEYDADDADYELHAAGKVFKFAEPLAEYVTELIESDEESDSNS